MTMMSETDGLSMIDIRDFMYKPAHFVRSHCKDDDEQDKSTQVWDVVFEPGQTGIVATCGGRYLCLFNVRSGELVRKYSHKERDHELFCLAWTSLKNGNFIATGSASGEVRLFHPDRLVSFNYWIAKKGQAVNAVKFHEVQPNWLFVATSSSVVSLWDIGDPNPPDYNGSQESILLSLSLDLLGSQKNDLSNYSLTWVRDTQWLLVGSSVGLLGWRVVENKVKVNQFPRYSPKMIRLILPPGPEGMGNHVDSVTSLGEGLVAAKCVGYGKIFIFRTDFTIEDGDFIMVEVLARFSWSKTDNFYMNIGGDVNLGLMGCGDDMGCIWLYNLPSWLLAQKKGTSKVLSPLGRLPWPELREEGTGISKEKNGSSKWKKETLLDKVAFSSCGKFIVAVTDSNIVAFWEKVDPEEIK